MINELDEMVEAMARDRLNRHGGTWDALDALSPRQDTNRRYKERLRAEARADLEAANIPKVLSGLACRLSGPDHTYLDGGEL